MTSLTTTTTTALDAPQSSRTRWLQRGAVVAIWLVAVIVWRQYQTSTGLGTTGTAQRFIDNVEMAWWGVLAFVGVYLARPLVLFPASVLTVVGGVLFGPVVGVLVVVVAANTSAMIAYVVGRALSRESTSDEPARVSLLARWSAKMRENSFETVLVMRLLFLPYDLVNYASGALRIRWVAFITATAIGSLPGTISFVLLGASLDRVDQGLDGLNPIALLASIVIFIVSLALARQLKKRHSAEERNDPINSQEATSA